MSIFTPIRAQATCPRPLRARRWSRIWRGAVAAPLAIALLTGCDGEPVTITGNGGGVRPTNPGTSGTGTTSSRGDSRLLGAWSRTVFLQDNTGAVHSSRTTWRFSTNAAATRSVVANNLTFGLMDSVVTAARWHTEGASIVLDYLPEGTGTARFDYFFQGTTLILGGIGFERQ
jgi:hypothetical protein